MSCSFDVEPKDYTRVIRKVEISSVSINLFNGANFAINIRDGNGVFIYNTTLFMDQPTYLEWSNDDTFAKNWVANQLNLTPIPM